MFERRGNDRNGARAAPLLFLAACVVLSGPVSAQEILWSDEFDSGTVPDPDVWSYDLGDWGWGNRELQDYTYSPDNARVENGNLVITAREIPWNGGTRITSARIRTQDKLTFRYGTVEARIRMPDLADGLWPAFWTLGNNFGEVGWPYCGELDIVEMGSGAAIAEGRINRRVGSAAHWDNAGSWASYSDYRDEPEDLDGEYHVFSMNWTPERVTTYIDGKQIWTYYIAQDSCADCSEFHKPHFLILNLAVGGNYTGILNREGITADMPAEMHVDWVRILDNGYTELGGSAAPVDWGGTGPEYSGSWYNEDQPGHGFSMEFGPNGTRAYAVVYWYLYDDEGNPIFFQGEGVPADSRLEVDFISPWGMVFGEFDPLSVNRPSGATGIFEFQDADHATFSYQPSEFTTTTWGHSAISDLPIVKLFSVVPTSAAVDE